MPDLDFVVLFRVRFEYDCELGLLRSVTDHTIGFGGQQTHLFALDAGDLAQGWVSRQIDRHAVYWLFSSIGMRLR
jgi:hypothetical protein